MEVNARTWPVKSVVVPKVADEPTCQKTLQACAPLISSTLLPLAVVRVEPAWKIKTAAGSFSASKIKVPVSPSELTEL
jgi:hypothetical protein